LKGLENRVSNNLPALAHMPVTGHVALTVTVAEVSDLGQNIEHTTYLPGCVRNEKGMTADRLAKRITGIDYFVVVVDGYDRNIAEALLARKLLKTREPRSTG
jgi:hypothetical protein